MVVTLRDLGIANSGIADISCTFNFIVVDSKFRSMLDTPVPLLYNLDNVFIEWVSNGRLTSFSKKNFKSLFDMAG